MCVYVLGRERKIKIKREYSSPLMPRCPCIHVCVRVCVREREAKREGEGERERD